jgi:hypothetical protein
LKQKNLIGVGFIILIFFPLVFFFSVSVVFPEGTQKIAIIANDSFPLSDFALSDLKEIYLGNKKFVGWTRLYPYHQQKDRFIKNLFIENALGLSPVSYMGYWHVKSFRDGSPPPIAYQSSTEIIENVKAKAGGLGYVWANDSTGIVGIRILLILEVQDNSFP